MANDLNDDGEDYAKWDAMTHEQRIAYNRRKEVSIKIRLGILYGTIVLGSVDYVLGVYYTLTSPSLLAILGLAVGAFFLGTIFGYSRS